MTIQDAETYLEQSKWKQKFIPQEGQLIFEFSKGRILKINDHKYEYSVVVSEKEKKFGIKTESFIYPFVWDEEVLSVWINNKLIEFIPV